MLRLMFKCLVLFVFAFLIVYLNINISKMTSSENGGRLICVSDYTKYFSFGNNSQLADFFWLRFLQETDAYNEFRIADGHLCPDQISSWHFHIINVAMDLDSRFYVMASVAPLIVSITISDSVGASKLFDKAVENFPNDWRILYQASYQAQIEEKNLKKAADLLYRAGKNGAPRWVLSLSGGLYNEIGMKTFADSVYNYLESQFPDDPNTKRLKDKLDNKIKNYFTKESK